MEGGCNSTTDSSNNYIVGNSHYRQMDCEEVISEGLVKINQQGAFSGERKLRSSELLSDRRACCVKAQDCSCTDSQSGTVNKLFFKYTKESKTLSQNDRNIHNLDEQTIKLLQSILARTEMNKDKVGTCTLKPDALKATSPHPSPDRNLELENFKLHFNPSKTLHLPPSSRVHSNFKSTVAKLTHKCSHDALTNKRKEKKSLSSKEKQFDPFVAFKEKLHHKDIENQRLAQLLLMKHQELRDVKEISKLKKVEAQLLVEKLNSEEQKNCEVTKRFNKAYDDMRRKLCLAKSNNESFAQQLKALMEKYERLKKRANTIKEQLIEERSKKKSSQKTVKKLEQMAEELLMNQTLLKKQRDAAAGELSACRWKMRGIEEENKENIRVVQRAEEERSAIKAEYETFRDELCKAQEENKKLMQAIQYNELEKEREVENLLQSQNVLKQVTAELDESKIQREFIHQELEARKKEINLIHHTYEVERLQLQEQQRTCMKQLQDMRTECEALKEVASKLKKDKYMLKQELECFQEEKAKSDTDSKREGKRLKEVVGLLERERELLLEEMRDLRKDYFSLSDRITQRLRQLDQTDAPMCITDISSFHHNRAPITDDRAPVTPSMDMIQHIRRKLEEEENTQKSLTTAFTIH